MCAIWSRLASIQEAGRRQTLCVSFSLRFSVSRYSLCLFLFGFWCLAFSFCFLFGCLVVFFSLFVSLSFDVIYFLSVPLFFVFCFIRLCLCLDVCLSLCFSLSCFCLCYFRLSVFPSLFLFLFYFSRFSLFLYWLTLIDFIVSLGVRVWKGEGEKEEYTEQRQIEREWRKLIKGREIKKDGDRKHSEEIRERDKRLREKEMGRRNKNPENIFISFYCSL